MSEPESKVNKETAAATEEEAAASITTNEVRPGPSLTRFRLTRLRLTRFSPLDHLVAFALTLRCPRHMSEPDPLVHPDPTTTAS